MKIDFQRPFAAPEGAQEVFLVRHGACDPPAPDGLVDGRSDPGLNERGVHEAASVAERLAGAPVCALFTTPMRRARETAEPLAERLGIEVVALPELIEVYLGEWEGHGIHMRGSSGDPEFLRVMREGYWDLIPGAESREAFGERVRAGLDIVADAAQPGEVAVAVTHSAVIAELLRQVTNSDPFAFIACGNGSLTRIVRMPDGRWTLIAFNDTSHVVDGHGQNYVPQR